MSDVSDSATAVAPVEIRQMTLAEWPSQLGFPAEYINTIVVPYQTPNTADHSEAAQQAQPTREIECRYFIDTTIWKQRKLDLDAQQQFYEAAKKHITKFKEDTKVIVLEEVLDIAIPCEQTQQFVVWEFPHGRFTRGRIRFSATEFKGAH